MDNRNFIRRKPQPWPTEPSHHPQKQPANPQRSVDFNEPTKIQTNVKCCVPRIVPIGDVTRTAGELDVRTRTLRVEAEVINGADFLLPGMYGTIAVANNPDPTTMLEAIQTESTSAKPESK